jgi:hypothetical protein
MIARHNLTLAAGHIAPKEALPVFREAAWKRGFAGHDLDLMFTQNLAQ